MLEAGAKSHKNTAKITTSNDIFVCELDSGMLTA